MQHLSYANILSRTTSHNALMIDGLMCRTIGCQKYAISMEEGKPPEARCIMCGRATPIQVEVVRP